MFLLYFFLFRVRELERPVENRDHDGADGAEGVEDPVDAVEEGHVTEKRDSKLQQIFQTFFSFFSLSLSPEGWVAALLYECCHGEPEIEQLVRGEE